MLLSRCKSRRAQTSHPQSSRGRQLEAEDRDLKWKLLGSLCYCSHPGCQAQPSPHLPPALGCTKLLLEAAQCPYAA